MKSTVHISFSKIRSTHPYTCTPDLPLNFALFPPDLEHGREGDSVSFKIYILVNQTSGPDQILEQGGGDVIH